MPEAPETEKIQEVQEIKESQPEEQKVDSSETQLEEEKKKYLYLYAEFENFKKRMIKERSDLIKFGWENIARGLLDVVDNLERAITHIPEKTEENLKKGIEMVHTHFLSTLEKQGVIPIEALGKAFNPELHEAMGQEPSPLPQGSITQVLLKGYMIHERLLRAARVIVSSGQGSNTNNNTSG